MAAAFKFTVIAAVLGALMRRQTERATAKGGLEAVVAAAAGGPRKETWPTSAASVVPIHFLHVVY